MDDAPQSSSSSSSSSASIDETMSHGGVNEDRSKQDGKQDDKQNGKQVVFDKQPTIKDAHESATFTQEAELRESGSWADMLLLLRITMMYVLMVMINGIVFGFSATAFHLTIHSITHFHRDYLGAMSLVTIGDWWFPVVHMTVAQCLSGLLVGAVVWKYIPDCAEGGTSAVKVCLAFGASVPLRVGVARFILTSIYIGFGNPLGSEAPTLHICAVLSSTVYEFVVAMFGEDWFPLENHHSIVVCGCACGLSAAFNTPLGGIMYALEEFGTSPGGVSSRILSLWIAMGSTMALITHRLLVGNEQFFTTDITHEITYELEPWMLLAFPLSVICALLSYSFARFVVFLRELRYTYVADVWSMGVGSTSAAIVFAVLWIISTYVDEKPFFLWGVGDRELEVLFKGAPIGTTLIFLIAKFLGCAIAVAFGGSGGLFMPALMMGGALGVLISSFSNDELMEEGSAATLGILCMGGFFSALLHLPLTSAIVCFEMSTTLTTRSNMILPLVICCMMSYYFSNTLSSHNIFEMLMTQDGVDDEMVQNLLDQAIAGAKDSEVPEFKPRASMSWFARGSNRGASGILGGLGIRSSADNRPSSLAHLALEPDSRNSLVPKRSTSNNVQTQLAQRRSKAAVMPHTEIIDFSGGRETIAPTAPIGIVAPAGGAGARQSEAVDCLHVAQFDGPRGTVAQPQAQRQSNFRGKSYIGNFALDIKVIEPKDE